MIGNKIPNIIFRTRVKDEEGNFGWQNMTTDNYFKGKSVILFSLPGAFTPTCSTYQLPNFEKMYADFSLSGIDEIYCMSVNDSFVMNAWAKNQELKNVKVIPDGSGEFTRQMGMLVKKDNLGFGYRSWRYAALIENCEVKKMWVEEGKMDNCPDDPYSLTDPAYIHKDLIDGTE
jgi:peroxiredoxin